MSPDRHGGYMTTRRVVQLRLTMTMRGTRVRTQRSHLAHARDRLERVVMRHGVRAALDGEVPSEGLKGRDRDFEASDDHDEPLLREKRLSLVAGLNPSAEAGRGQTGFLTAIEDGLYEMQRVPVDTRRDKLVSLAVNDACKILR